MSKKITILVLAANPKGTSPLRLDEEVREIHEGLSRMSRIYRFEINQRWAVRPRDVRRAMLDYKPDIVHFCGHGSGDEGLVLENESGQEQLVSTEAISCLFELFSGEVKCVVLNACFSEAQARAIAQHVDYVIGMSREINDKAAIEFAIGFYDAIAAAKPYALAFKFGCNAIQLAGLSGHLTPILIKKLKDAAASTIGEAKNGRVERKPSICRDHSFAYRNFSELNKLGQSVKDVLEKLTKIDYETIPLLDDVSEGKLEQWQAIAENNPDGYGFVTKGSSDIIGYWHFEALQEDIFEKAIKGELEESDITVDRIQYLCIPGIYDIYFIIFAVDKRYRGFRINRMLFEAFLDRLEMFAHNGIYVRRICANALTPEGVGLCKSVKMQYLRPHKRIGHIFFIDLQNEFSIISSRPQLLSAIEYLKHRNAQDSGSFKKTS